MNSQVKDRLEAFVAKSAIPQLNIGIWRKGEQYQGSFGTHDNAQVDVFETGSIGKTFTATLLAVLAEEGVVNLDDSLDKYQPELPFAKEITLLQLVTHTAGLPDNPFKGLVLNAEKALFSFGPAEYHDYLMGLKKPLKTGKPVYSNLGMALLGNILADHLGLSYENAVKKHVLNPLGMSDTHVSTDAYAVQRLAIGHNGKGKPVPHFSWSCMEPAGIWRSTSSDMLVFLKAHLGHSGEYWKHLLEKTTSPAFDDPKRKQVGLAWQLSHNEVFGDHAWHNGQTLGQKSMAVCAKEGDSAIVILSNKVPKLWQYFFPSYSLEKLSFDVFELLEKERSN